MALNKVSIMGRITGDLELKHVGANNDIPTISFGIACDRDFKNKETGEKEVDFFNCTAWRGTAEFIAKYFGKGRMIVIDGRLQRRDYEKDGVKHQNVFINIDNAYFGDSKQNAEGGQPAGATNTSATQPAPAGTAPAGTTVDPDGFLNALPDDDGLPFM